MFYQFRLYFDKSRADCWSEIEERLLPLCSEVISYFLTLSSEAHSDAWTNVLLLLFTQLEKLNDERLRRFSGPIYPLLCQLWCVDVRPEVQLTIQDFVHISLISLPQVCSVLRNLFLKIGTVYGISVVSNGVGVQSGNHVMLSQ